MTPSERELLLAANMFLEIATDRLNDGSEPLEAEQYIHAAHNFVQAVAYGTRPDNHACELFAALIADAAVKDAASDSPAETRRQEGIQKV